MNVNKIDSVSGCVERKHENVATLDYALEVAGLGWYNIKYSLVLSLFLIAAIVDPVGYSYVLPAAKCDLEMTDAQRGFLASIPYIGIVITSFPWGYLVDTKGRKLTIVYSSLTAGGFAILSSFMPDFISFTVCKFLTSIWRRAQCGAVYTILTIPMLLWTGVSLSISIACPAAVPYTFIGEIVPMKYRDITLSVTNALQVLGTTLVPLLAWAILPLEFRGNFGLYEFRSWRLLTITYGSTFIIAALLLLLGPESPKYLLSQGRHDETLEVLKTIYSNNKRRSMDEYPITSLKTEELAKNEKLGLYASLKSQSIPLFRAPYFKWMALNSLIFFGLFSTLNGLYVWLPDVLNRVLTGDGDGFTACEVIAQRLNETSQENTTCNDSIESSTFVINSVANICCAFVAITASSSVKLIGKKTLLTSVLILIGVFCILINVVTNDILFAIFISSIPVLGLAIGPVNAYAVQIFPTNLRGMAISLSMMMGRVGSIFGTNVAGALINAFCEVTFYFFGGLLIICGLSSFLLPASKKKETQDIIISKL